MQPFLVLNKPFNECYIKNDRHNYSLVLQVTMNVNLFFVLLVSLSSVQCYKILFLVPFNAKSHWLFLETFVKTLLERQHEVTCVTSNSLAGTHPANYTEILIEPALDFESIISQDELFKISEESSVSILFKLAGIRKFSAEYAFESVQVQQFLQRQDLHYDLVINEEFFQESFSMFAYKYKTPLVTISTYGNSDFFDHQMGLITPWSHVPNLLLHYDDNMNFIERCHNTYISVVDWLIRQYLHLPYQAEIAEKYFAPLAPLPSIEYVLKNVSLILVNTHRSVLTPRPHMPGIINVGGAHIKPPKTLPDDLKTFLDEAAHGVIYFSLGTLLKSSQMPREKLEIFLESFKILKQRVVWKYESETIAGIPSNVMIRKWLPQTDLLSHKNVVLFITHGGMFGNFEAIARGVPLLVIPFFADQHRNAFRVVKMGYGKSLNFVDMTKESLNDVLQEILSNNSYANKVREISAIYGDNLVHPMDEAMFWIEYVCRHRGAKHLKSHAVNMPIYKILLIDVIVITLLLGILLISLLWCLLRKSIRKNGHVVKRKVN